MKNNLKALALTLGIMAIFAATNDASDMLGAQIMQSTSSGEPTLTSIEATENEDGTVTVNFEAKNTTTYALNGDISNPIENQSYSERPVMLTLANPGNNNVNLILSNENISQTILMKFGETGDDLLKTEITKAFPNRKTDQLLQIVKNPLAFHVDAINAGEVPFDTDNEHPLSITVGKDEKIVLFGAMISPLRYNDTQIIATVQNTDIQTLVPKNGSGLFSIELPKLTSGNYTISIESTDGKNFGPLIDIPVSVDRLLDATVPQKTIKEFNWVLAGFMTFVILLSGYAFFIYRRKVVIVTPGTV